MSTLALDRIAAPSLELADIGDQQRARFLAIFLFVLVSLGWVAGLVQVVVVPGFLPRFIPMAAALSVLTLAYVLSRTRHYHAAAILACAAPPAACIVIGLRVPADPVWWAFAELGVLLAVIFLDGRFAAMIGAAIAAAVAIVLIGQAGATPASVVPPVAFHAIVTPLMLVGAAHRNGIERQRQQALSELEAAQRMATIGHLAGGVAHDFNNLLTIVKGQIEEPTADGRGDAQQAVHRAAELTRQLMSYAGRGVGQPENVDLRDAVRSVERLVRVVTGSRVSVSIETSPSPVPVRIDQSQLAQMLVNLAMNARDAMSGPGALVISVGTDDRPAGDPPRASAIVTVQDTGSGMPDEVRARLFEPFFTTKGNRGTGLGLFTVRAIVEQHGGAITVDSTPGLGTTFSISFPLRT